MSGVFERTLDMRGESNLDLEKCAEEPIHLPGSIQPHGVLLVLDAGARRVLHVSANAEQLLGIPVADCLGRRLDDVLGEETARRITEAMGLALPTAEGRDIAAEGNVLPPATSLYLGTVSPATDEAVNHFHAVAHRSGARGVLELEPAAQAGSPDVYALVDQFSVRVEAAQTIEELCRLTSREVRRLIGFDRVLIYQFDSDWNGTVVGEDRNDRLPSYLDHRFPASDIPAQARELYRLNRIRIIPDCDYRPVKIIPEFDPQTGEPLDLSFSILRSVSPVHVEYMKNMETAASMSISILRDGELWGLISCHHAEPKRVGLPLRGTCDLFARVFSQRLSALTYRAEDARRANIRSTYSELLAAMTADEDFAAALHRCGDRLLAYADASGAAIVDENNCRLVGRTPSESEVRELVRKLFDDSHREVFITDSLSAFHGPAERYVDTASGLLAVATSKLMPRYVMWFRTEVVRTIRWGGDPHKAVDAAERLTPRRSFETWKQTVRRRSLPWDAIVIEGAAELRHAIVGIVLRRAEGLAKLNAELARSNRELEAFSYSVSHDLRAPLRHIAGYAEMVREYSGSMLSERAGQWIDSVIDSAEYAGRLVDKLLEYSRLGKSELVLSNIDMNALVAESRDRAMRGNSARNIQWQIADLPPVQGDLMMLRMALGDLLSNAVKYTRGRDPAMIEVGTEAGEEETVFYVRDNGVGFDMQYSDKLFGVFQRLHRWEDYEGTGIGLANLRRVIERHDGRVWADAEEGKGATFYFALPTCRDQSVDLPGEA